MQSTSRVHDDAHQISESPELSPLDIGEEFAPIRIPKPAGQTSVSFSGLLHPPLQLHEDLKESCGGQLWPAGIVLGRYILERIGMLRGKVVIEIGAGGGLTGLGLAMALKASDKRLVHPILITDLPQLLPLQRQNIAMNGLSPQDVMSASFPWGGGIPDTVPLAYHKPDLILAADCVYFEPAFPLLLESLQALLEHDGLSSDTLCLFCMKKRRKADMRFIATMKKLFVVTELKFEPADDEEKNVHLYEVRRRTASLG